MRRPALVSFPLLVVLLFAMPLHAQERSAELQRFAFWVGKWADTPDGTPDQICSWVGASFLQCPVFGEDGTVSTIHIMGYDEEAQAYTASRFYGSGFHDTGMGWADGNTWTILYLDNPARIIRWTGVEVSEDSFSYKWERSVNGGEWVETSGGMAYRVR